MHQSKQSRDQGGLVRGARWLFPAVLAVLTAVTALGCTFDTARLDELRRQMDAGDTSVQDIPVEDPSLDLIEDAEFEDVTPDIEPTDLVSDVPDVTDLTEVDAADATDVPQDLADLAEVDQTDTADIPQDTVDVTDMVQDPPVDVADVSDVSDTATDPDLDAIDLPDEVTPEPVNQPPVITIPGLQTAEETQPRTITGTSVSDPDVGGADMAVTLAADLGVMTLETIPNGLTFTDGNGQADNQMSFEGTLAEINTALASIIYLSNATGAAEIDITVSDLGHTGTGGAKQDAETIQVHVIERTFDFTIQRGSDIFGSGSTTLTLTAGTDYDAPSGPAFFRIVNTRLTGMGRTGGGGKQFSGFWMVWVDETVDLSTSITLRRFNQDFQTDATDDCRVTWEIIEYTGAVGGPNEMVVHRIGVATYGTSSTTVSTTAVAGVESDADVVVFITGQAANSGETTKTQTGMSTSSWNAADDMAVFTRWDSQSREAKVSYAVVEFVGENWSVQRVEHTFTENNTTETEPISSVGSLDLAFLHAQFRSRYGTIDDLGGEVWLSGAEELSALFRTHFQDQYNTVVAWVLSNSQDDDNGILVRHYSFMHKNGSNEEDTWTNNITEIGDLDHTSIMGECGRSKGEDDSVPRGSVSLYLGAVDRVTLKQSDNGQEQNYRFSIVEWPDAPLE